MSIGLFKRSLGLLHLADIREGDSYSGGRVYRRWVQRVAGDPEPAGMLGVLANADDTVNDRACRIKRQIYRRHGLEQGSFLHIAQSRVAPGERRLFATCTFDKVFSDTVAIENCTGNRLDKKADAKRLEQTGNVLIHCEGATLGVEGAEIVVWRSKNFVCHAGL